MMRQLSLLPNSFPGSAWERTDSQAPAWHSDERPANRVEAEPPMQCVSRQSLGTRVLALLALFFMSTMSYAASPTLGVITPRGGQRGTEVEFTFHGARLKDAQEILFYTPGFTAGKIEVVNDNVVKTKIKIAADARLGQHNVRVRTASGISDLKTFFVGALPEIYEKEPNNEFKSPQKIPLNVTVNGTIENEDVDYFAVDCKKGQRLSVEIEGMRLANQTIFDPAIAILNSKRFEIAVSDDSAFAGQDGVMSVIIPEDGTYTIMVRETSYGGNGECRYRLHVGTFPRPVACIPAGGKLGEEVEITFLGDATGPIKQKIKLPATPDANFGLFVQDANGISPSPLPFRLSTLGNFVETAPSEFSKANVFDPNTQAINGIISKPGENDYYRWKGKKGQVFDVHCYARRIRSALDPVMHMHKGEGGYIVGDDDAIKPDCYFRFTVPEDKEYVLQLHDHLQKGGATFSYRVEFTPVVPSLSLFFPKVDGNNLPNQDRQAVGVPQGNRMAVLTYASRANFGGPLQMYANGLPKGMTLTADVMADNVDAVPVVLDAAADAPIAGGLIDWRAKHVDPKVNIDGGMKLRADLVYQQNVGSYIGFDTDQAAIAVTQPVPFKVSLVEPKAPLVQNGAMNLKVKVERNKDFKQPVNVYMLWNPPGIGSASGVTVPGDKAEFDYPVNATPTAPTRKWKICVIAFAEVGFGPAWVSSQLITLDVGAPYVSMSMDRPAVEQGKETELLCKLTLNKPFEGTGKVHVVGLPHNVKAPVMDITKETKEITVKLTTQKDSPPGQHQGIFAQVYIPEQGEQMLHQIGGTVLRIDAPQPAKPAAAAPVKVAAATPAPTAPAKTEKKLSRLEKLRLEQAEKEKAGGK